MASAPVGVQINEPSPMPPLPLARPSKVREGKGKGKKVVSEFESGYGASVSGSLCPPLLPKVVHDDKLFGSSLASLTGLLPIAETSSPTIPVSNPTSILCANDALSALGNPCDVETDMARMGIRIIS